MGINKQEPKLLDKYNLPISSLNYEYIKNSKNVKELEKILIILRSGEEGIFPDLIKFCEDKLCQLCPNSKYLEASSAKVHISPAERKAVENDLQDWVNEIKECEHKLFAHSSKCSASDAADIPVRDALDMKHCHDFTGDEDANSKKLKNNKSSNSFKTQKKSEKKSFSDWDRLNVEEELKKLETNECESKASASGVKCKRVPLKPFVDNTGMTEEECKIVAEQEKVKGNEAFKAQDYEEADIYYSRSISCYPLIASLNNRAFTSIKLKNFTAALCDCNTVLSLEADNVKALYRRGLAYTETSRIQLAYADFQKVLELDPGNKAAKEKIESIEENPCGFNEKSSVKIEEVTGSDTASKPSHQIEVSSSSSSLSTAPKKGHSSLEKHSASIVQLPGGESEFSSGRNGQSDKESGLPHLPEICDSSVIDKEQNVSSVATSCAEDRGFTKSSSSVVSDKKFHKLKVETCSCINQKTCGKSFSTDTKCCDEVNSLLSDPNFSIVCEHLNEAESEKLPDQMKSSEKSMNGAGLDLNLPKTLEHDSLSEITEKVTPFKFLALWHSTAANKDAYIGATLLKKIPPSRLPAVLSNKLDGDFLFQLIQAVTIIAQGDVDKGFEYMMNLTKVPRIKTITLFFSQDEKEDVEKLLSSFKLIGKDVTHLQSTFVSQ